jgi:hypothetical protein
MKRFIIILLAVVALAGVAAAPASATVPVNGCDVTAYYSVRPDGNDLIYSPATQASGAFYTPMRRSGGCRHVMVENFGVWDGGPILSCMQGHVRTYNEDGSLRVRGSWVEFNNLFEIHDLRNTIDNRRWYRVFVRSCNPDRRTQDHHVGIQIYAQ